MGKLILVTGGQRSGKSKYAEDLCQAFGTVTYIATGVATDGEMSARIQAHKARRSDSWKTIETPGQVHLAASQVESEAVLLDSVTTLIGNIMYDFEKKCTDLNACMAELEAAVLMEIDSLINAATKSSAVFVIVSDECGLGLISEHVQGRLFCDLLGRANQAIGMACSEAYFIVSAMGVKLK